MRYSGIAPNAKASDCSHSSSTCDGQMRYTGIAARWTTWMCSPKNRRPLSSQLRNPFPCSRFQRCSSYIAESPCGSIRLSYNRQFIQPNSSVYAATASQTATGTLRSPPPPRVVRLACGTG